MKRSDTRTLVDKTSHLPFFFFVETNYHKKRKSDDDNDDDDLLSGKVRKLGSN